MSVVSVERLVGDSAQEQGAEGSRDLRFLALCDDKHDGPAVVLASSMVPQYGDILTGWEPTNPSAAKFRCTDRSATVRSGAPKQIEVDCTFSAKFAEYADRHAQPTNRRAKVTIGTRKVEVPLIVDAVTDELIVNTAGDPPDPPRMRTRSLTTYQVDVSVPSYEGWIFDLRDTTNKFPISIRGRLWPKHTLYVDSVSVSDEEWQQQLYFKTSITIIGDPLTHKDRFLNDGLFMAPISRNKERRPCQDPYASGERATKPQLLDALGEQIDTGAATFNLKTSPVWLEPHRYPEADWSQMASLI